MINTNLVMTSKEWESYRNSGLHIVKLKRLGEYQKFLDWVDIIKPKYNGYLTYYEKFLKTERHLSYSEGCPIFNFFKLVPGGNFITDFSLEHLSDDYPIRDDIEEILDKNILKKWDDSFTKPVNFKENDYILFLTQHLWSKPQLDILKSVIQYSIDNKEILVIKEHIIPPEGMIMYKKAVEYVKKVSQKYDNIHFIDKTYETYPLLDNAKYVWSVNSSVGLTAIIRGKRYSYFTKNMDFAFHIAAHNANSIEEAVKYDFSYEKFLSKFSWYYDKMVIDVNDENHFYKLDKQFYRFYNEQISDIEYFK
jgi:hypothetical protein